MDLLTKQIELFGQSWPLWSLAILAGLLLIALSVAIAPSRQVPARVGYPTSTGRR